MFYGQCNACGERWELGTASTCKCPQPDIWVELTEEELHEIYDAADDGQSPCGICGACAKCKREVAIAKAVAAKLKGKNHAG